MTDFLANARLARLRERLQRIFARARFAPEPQSCPDRVPPGIGKDLSLGTPDRRTQQGSHPGPDELLPHRLEQLGLHPEYLEMFEGSLYRDLRSVCASCRSWRRCARDLAAGDVQCGMQSYCLNAASIDALVVERFGKPRH